MTATAFTDRRELTHRSSDGIDTLFSSIRSVAPLRIAVTH
jgi:hypothetical protein